MGYLSIYNRPWGVVAMGDIENKTALDTIIEELRTVSAGNNWNALEAIVDRLIALSRRIKAKNDEHIITNELAFHVISFLFEVGNTMSFDVDAVCVKVQHRFNQMLELIRRTENKQIQFRGYLIDAGLALRHGDARFLQNMLSKLYHEYDAQTKSGEFSPADAVVPMDNITRKILLFCEQIGKAVCSNQDVYYIKSQFVKPHRYLLADAYSCGWSDDRLRDVLQEVILGNVTYLKRTMAHYTGNSKDCVDAIKRLDRTWHNLLSDKIMKEGRAEDVGKAICRIISFVLGIIDKHNTLGYSVTPSRQNQFNYIMCMSKTAYIQPADLSDYFEQCVEQLVKLGGDANLFMRMFTILKSNALDVTRENHWLAQDTEAPISPKEQEMIAFVVKISTTLNSDNHEAIMETSGSEMFKLIQSDTHTPHDDNGIRSYLQNMMSNILDRRSVFTSMIKSYLLDVARGNKPGVYTLADFGFGTHIINLVKWWDIMCDAYIDGQKGVDALIDGQKDVDALIDELGLNDPDP